VPLDPFARRFLELARATAEGRADEPSIADMRRTTEALAAFGAPERARPVGTSDTKLSEGPRAIPIRIYIPASAPPEASAGLVYIHGGGWVSGDLDTHDPLCRALADEGRCRVISLDYRLAPEHRFPAAIDDCRTAFDLVISQAKRLSLDPQRIGVAGDSAGANLAAVLCQERQSAKPAIALQLLLCPVLDAIGRTASRSALAKNYFIEERTMARYFESYRIDGVEPDDPRVSPLRTADLSGLPKTRIHTAEFDPLRDEAILYAERLSEAGVDARVTVHSGMIHHFYGLSAIVPYARIGLAAIGADIRDALGESAPRS
jgi:acetyl esterase/lipase